MVDLEDRYLGALFGCAVGDALGTTLENQRTPKELLKDMVGGGPFQLLPGCWTDDTTMMLLLTESLVEKRGFDPQDQLTRYLEWYREGRLSSNGECFDIGITTRMAVEKFEKKPEDYPATVGEKARAGNGSLMRICPIPLRYRKNPQEAMQRAIDSSRTTHGSVMCTDACRYYTSLFLGIFQGFTKDQLLQSSFLPNDLPSDYWISQPLCSEVQTVVDGSWRSKELKSTGFVIDSLECALEAFATTDSFRDGLIKVVNLGGDSDTAGAIYGQLAGCYYGYKQLPKEWREKVALKSLIEVFAKELLHDSEGKETTQEYRDVQKCYRLLETNYKPILRKLLPGPRAYKEMSDFESDVQEFVKQYQENCTINNAIQYPELLADFQSRFEYNRENVKKKLDRANMFAKR